MIYVVAKIQGKQYKVSEDQEIVVDRFSAKVGQKVDIKDILLVSQDETKLVGEDAKKATIKASVVSELQGDKVLVLKYKKRKRYRKLTGHRQALTKIKIESIDFPGKKPVGSKKLEVGSKKPKEAKPSASKPKSKEAAKTVVKKEESKKAQPSKEEEKSV